MENKPVFGLITAITSISFCLIMYSFAWLNFPQLATPGIIYLVLIFVFIVLENVFDLYLFMKKNQEHRLRSKIRGLILISILAYAICSLLRTQPFPKIFLPEVINIVPVVALVIASIIVYLIRVPIFHRNYLYKFIELNSHLSLMEAFNREPSLVFGAFRKAKSLRLRSFFIVIISTFLVGLNSLVTSTPWFLIVSYVCTMLSALSLVALANIFLEEHRFFSFGQGTQLEFKRHKLKWALAIIICCFVPVLFFSSSSALFAHALDKFFNIFQGIGYTTTPHLDELLSNQGQEPGLFNQIQNPFANSTVDWLSQFAALGKYFILTVFIGLILVVIGRYFSKLKLKPSQIFATLINQLRDLILLPFMAFLIFCRNLFRVNSAKPAKVGKMTLPHIKTREYLKFLKRSANRSGINKNTRQSRESIVAYSKFLEWIFNQDIRWTLADTPFDIANRTIEFLSLHLTETQFETAKTATNELTSLLEQDLFSRTEIGTVGLEAMKRNITTIVSLKLNL